VRKKVLELNEQSDKEILARFKTEKLWGLSCSVDLKNCNPKKIKDAESIRKFVIKLCDFINMNRVGEPSIIYFDDTTGMSGFSMTQLIDTSLVSGHFVDDTNSAYLDICSCKEYPPKEMAEFCKAFFEADDYDLNVVFRK
jgi:S-adenosylmethionine/arginine decarboxylase-like enzyme